MRYLLSYVQIYKADNFHLELLAVSQLADYTFEEQVEFVFHLYHQRSKDSESKVIHGQKTTSWIIKN